MITLPVRVASLILLLAAPAPAADLTVDQLRAAYTAARPKLEAIWDSPARYTFQHTSQRSNIPEKHKNQIPPRSQSTFRVYGQRGRWRLDFTIENPGGQFQEMTTVSTNNDQFVLRKPADAQKYDFVNLGDNLQPITNEEKTIAVLCGAAYTLPNRIDVRDILFGMDYKLRIVPEGEAKASPGTVTCDFESASPVDPNARPIRLYYASGRITFLPDRDWAIDRFQLLSIVGISVEGLVTYQEIPGMASRAVPLRLEYTSRNTSRSSIITQESLEATEIIPGPVEDRVFQLASFPLNNPAAVTANLNTKLPEPFNPIPWLITLGLALVVVAGFLALRARHTAT